MTVDGRHETQSAIAKYHGEVRACVFRHVRRHLAQPLVAAVPRRVGLCVGLAEVDHKYAWPLAEAHVTIEGRPLPRRTRLHILHGPCGNYSQSISLHIRSIHHFHIN